MLSPPHQSRLCFRDAFWQADRLFSLIVVYGLLACAGAADQAEHCHHAYWRPVWFFNPSSVSQGGGLEYAEAVNC